MKDESFEKSDAASASGQDMVDEETDAIPEVQIHKFQEIIDESNDLALIDEVKETNLLCASWMNELGNRQKELDVSDGEN